MTCVKTGCHIYLHNYGEFAYGDAFEVGDTYVFRLVTRDRQPVNGLTVIHFAVHDINLWFDEHLTSQLHISTLIAAKYKVTNLGYKGVDFKKHLGDTEQKQVQKINLI